MSIRELTRHGNMSMDYDFIEIEDRKTKEYKGVFVSQKYAQIVKNFLIERLKQEREDKLKAIMKFAGSMDGETKGMSSQEIKTKKRKDYDE